jgi:ergothioneine biosynthesis protein EgtB
VSYLIETLEEHSRESALSVIVLGLHHEHQHQELILTDVKTVLAMNPLRPIYRDREVTSHDIPEIRWIPYEAGLTTIGSCDDDFHFDNEEPSHKYYLESFELANRLVTNGEYQRFIEAGGYREPSLWLSDGWALAQREAWQAPKYWERPEGKAEWWNMTLQGFRPVEPSEPVTHLSYYEADAYATWAGARLPMEFEWEHAARHTLIERTNNRNLLEAANFHPIPLAPTESEDTFEPRIQQLYGDCWEWTRSAYLPYPGYQAVEGALGEYNGKFMSGQMVLRGGSCATALSHIRSTYRNFFPPESRWQFSGIRLARDRNVPE